MDYKIKFEYKGIGDQTSKIRQKVLQSQKTAEKRASIAPEGKKESIISVKNLNSSIKKLITSNKQLATEIRRSAGMGGGGIPSPLRQRKGPGFSPTGGGGGFGRIGSSVPLVGAAIAVTGFAIQKINQIGSAYLNLATQQKGTAGVAGFRRRGAGMYLAEELASGMKAYGLATGKFAKGVAPAQAALDIGAIYGLSAQETLGQAGVFKRAGASYERTAYMAAGAGIETELPTLTTGIAKVLEESVKNGINTSDMSKDIGKELITITQKTSTKSIDAAFNIIRSFEGVKKTVGEGRMSGLAGVYATRAARGMLTERLTGKDKEQYLERLQKEGMISAEQRKTLTTLSPNASFRQIQKRIGAPTAYALEERMARETDTGKLLLGTMGELQKEVGTKPEAMHRWSRVMSDQFGGAENFRTAFLASAGKDQQSKQNFIEQQKTGKKAISRRAKGVERGEAGMAIDLLQAQQRIIFKHGQKFAKTSIALNKSMISIVETIDGGKEGGGVNRSLLRLASTAQSVAKAFEDAKKMTDPKNIKKTLKESAKVAFPTVYQLYERF